MRQIIEGYSSRNSCLVKRYDSEGAKTGSSRGEDGAAIPNMALRSENRPQQTRLPRICDRRTRLQDGYKGPCEPSLPALQALASDAMPPDVASASGLCLVSDSAERPGRQKELLRHLKGALEAMDRPYLELLGLRGEA